MAATVERAQYDALAEAFRRTPGDFKAAAKAVGCSPKVARRAWEYGWAAIEWARPIKGAAAEPPPAAVTSDVVAESARPSGRRGGKDGEPVDRATYEAMVAAWAERGNVNYTAKTCHVTRDTVRKYVNEGDPARDMPPIRERAKAIVAAVEARTDAAIVEAEVEMAEISVASKRVALQQLKRRIEDQETFGAESLGAFISHVDKLDCRLKGVAGATIKVEITDGRTRDELLDVLEGLVVKRALPEPAADAEVVDGE